MNAETAAILDLFEEQLGKDRSHAWFEWKYDRNPFTDRIPVFVAQVEGRIIGAAGFVPLRMHVPSGSVRAIMPGDVAVDPVYEGRGIVDDLLQHGIEYATRAGYAFAWDASMPFTIRPYTTSDWHTVAPLETFVRIHRVSPLQNRFTGSLDSVVGGITESIARIHRQIDGLRRTLTSAPVDVIRSSGVPASLLADDLSNAVPRGIHAERTEAFYRWRYANPSGSYDTYIVYRHGSPVAAAVLERVDVRDVTIATLVELRTPDEPGRKAALRAPLLGLVAADHADSDLILAPSSALPQGKFERLGFFGDRQLPLSLFSRTHTLRVRPLGNRIGTRDVTTSNSWQAGLAVRALH